MSKLFDEKLSALGITLTEKQYQQFDKYYELLVEWNKVMNLTGITEYEEVNEKHFIDWRRSLRAAYCRGIDAIGASGYGGRHERGTDQ